MFESSGIVLCIVKHDILPDNVYMCLFIHIIPDNQLRYPSYGFLAALLRFEIIITVKDTLMG